MRLSGKIAIITGAAAGIGAATARRFAQEGASVVLTDRDGDSGEGVAASIREEGGTAEFILADVSEAAAIERVFERTMARFGGLDILHNNAAGSINGYVADLGLEEWERALKIGLTPYFYASKLALPHMVARGGGAIVNTASISGLFADHGLGAYNIAKAGVINLTRNIAIDYARHNIRCNAVCPGIIYTNPFELVRKHHPDLIEDMAASVPLGRFGTPEEIANVVLFLASDEASFVTGATLTADGGATARTGTPSMLEGLASRTRN